MNISKRTQASYEAGETKPTFDYLLRLHESGFDAFYVLTGELRHG